MAMINAPYYGWVDLLVTLLSIVPKSLAISSVVEISHVGFDGE
jgi:hypothetical protein